MSSSNKQVYLDFNATTPYAPTVQEIMSQVVRDFWGNPSSNYKRGKEAKGVIEKSRTQVGDLIGANASEIIFVSGGTEANNVAIKSVIENFRSQTSLIPHVISTSIEHDATLKVLERLLAENKINVSFLLTNSDGSVEAETVKNSIKNDTALVTLMLANNETGALLNLQKICDSLEEINARRRDNGLGKVYLHVDAAQALGKIPVSVKQTPVDYLTIVGHKFYGPRIGALYIKDGSPLRPLIEGGGQENCRRPGTENTVCIAGLGEAAKLAGENLLAYNAHFQTMKNYLKTKLHVTFPKGSCIVNFPDDPDRPQLPNTLSISFPKFSGNRILADCPWLEASTGAACHSSTNVNTASKMLLNLLPEEQAIGTVRLSLGRETTTEDIDLAVNYLKETIDKY